MIGMVSIIFELNGVLNKIDGRGRGVLNTITFFVFNVLLGL